MTKSLAPYQFQRLIHNIQFPPSESEIANKGELNTSEQKGAKTGKKMYHMKLTYSSPGSGSFCRVRAVAAALEEDTFLTDLMKFSKNG